MANREYLRESLFPGLDTDVTPVLFECLGNEERKGGAGGDGIPMESSSSNDDDNKPDTHLTTTIADQEHLDRQSGLRLKFNDEQVQYPLAVPSIYLTIRRCHPHPIITTSSFSPRSNHPPPLNHLPLSKILSYTSPHSHLDPTIPLSPHSFLTLLCITLFVTPMLFPNPLSLFSHSHNSSCAPSKQLPPCPLH